MSRRRAAHGALAAAGVTTTWESTASDEVRAVPPEAAAPVERRGNGTVTPAGAVELARRRWEAEKQPDFADGAEPWMPPTELLAPFDTARKALLALRRDEIATMTGGVSAGVGAKLRGWSYMHAAAEYWAARFFASGDQVAYDLMLRGFARASTAEDQARDAAAWEAAARPRDPMAELNRRLAAFGASTSPAMERTPITTTSDEAQSGDAPAGHQDATNGGAR